jgi:hypothetical protein
VHTIDLPDMPEPGGAPPEKSVHPPQDQANLLGIITDVGATDNGGRERCVIPPRSAAHAGLRRIARRRMRLVTYRRAVRMPRRACGEHG